MMSGLMVLSAVCVAAKELGQPVVYTVREVELASFFFRVAWRTLLNTLLK